MIASLAGHLLETLALMSPGGRQGTEWVGARGGGMRGLRPEEQVSEGT